MAVGDTNQLIHDFLYEEKSSKRVAEMIFSTPRHWYQDKDGFFWIGGVPVLEHEMCEELLEPMSPKQVNLTVEIIKKSYKVKELDQEYLFVYNGFPSFVAWHEQEEIDKYTCSMTKNMEYFVSDTVSKRSHWLSDSNYCELFFYDDNGKKFPYSANYLLKDKNDFIKWLNGILIKELSLNLHSCRK